MVNLRKEELGSAIGLYTIIILPRIATTNNYYRIIIIKKIKLQLLLYYLSKKTTEIFSISRRAYEII